jgi:hypothetical protein
MSASKQAIFETMQALLLRGPATSMQRLNQAYTAVASSQTSVLRSINCVYVGPPLFSTPSLQQLGAAAYVYTDRGTHTHTNAPHHFKQGKFPHMHIHVGAGC